MPTEKLSIKRMRVLGAFPAVLDDLNFKFSQVSMPPDPTVYHSVHSKEKARNKITDKLPVHSFESNLTMLMRKQKCKQGMWKVGEPRG